METGIGAALSQLIELMVSGLVDFASGVAGGINEYVISLMFETQTIEGVTSITGLSAAGGFIAIAAALSLAVGLTSLLWNFLSSLGN